MASREYHKNYWERYKQQHRQVTLTLTAKEYAEWERRARKHGRKFVGQQIKAEALAYRQSEQLLSAETEEQLAELSRVWRGIGTNLNQIAHHSNRFERLVLESEAIELLKQVEAKSRAWLQAVRDK